MMGAAVAAMLVAGAAQADDAAGLLSKFKAATGGARWDAVKTMQASGTLKAGGLSGEITVTQDLASGRSSDSYQLGPVAGADGYDGAHAWERDPGGEVAVLDAPPAVRRARSQAWLDARGYWYPERIKATYGKVETREADGRRYRVIEATPENGDAVALWFAEDTGLLARTVQRRGSDTVTTMLDDYRDVDGVRLPFHSVTDITDAAGRTDPRARTEVQLAKVAFGARVTDADFAVPKMAATAHIDEPGGVTRIPFDLVNNHIYVNGTVDGKPVRFLVDTGGVNLLTPASAKKLGLEGEGKLVARGVGEKSVDLAVAHAKNVRVGGATLDNPVFYVIDLGDLPKVEGVACDGLVGYEMFRRFGVTIDYAGHVLTLAEPKRFTPPAGATVVPFELDERIPIVTGTLDGESGRISIDTGSRASLSLHAPFVHKHNLVARYRAAPEAVLGWGVGGAARSRPARFGTLDLGNLEINGIAGDLFTGDKGAFANPDLIANLGGGVLHRFTVAFDYAAKRMYLVPNADFARPDAFDRSGLFLLGDGDALKIVDVARKSAAERAGLHDGDRIVAIDGHPVASAGLADWRRQLRERAVGTRVTLAIERDGRRRNVAIVLADRIPETVPRN